MVSKVDVLFLYLFRIVGSLDIIQCYVPFQRTAATWKSLLRNTTASVTLSYRIEKCCCHKVHFHEERKGVREMNRSADKFIPFSLLKEERIHKFV